MYLECACDALHSPLFCSLLALGCPWHAVMETCVAGYNAALEDALALQGGHGAGGEGEAAKREAEEEADAKRAALWPDRTVRSLLYCLLHDPAVRWAACLGPGA